MLTLRCFAIDLLALLRRVVARIELPRVLARIGAILCCCCRLRGHLQFTYLAL